MNPRIYNQDDGQHFYGFEPSWFFEGANIIERSSAIYREIDTIRESIDSLKELAELHDRGAIKAGVFLRKAPSVVRELVESIEILMYVFPELGMEYWLHRLWQDGASAHWRAEEGYFDDSPDGLRAHIEDILTNISQKSAQKPSSRLSRHIEQLGSELYWRDVEEEYWNDVFEARDLFCIGYHSTALLVLGRAVEKLILEIGQLRKIRSLNIHGGRDWVDASFSWRNKALYRVDHPNGDGKLIDKRQYHEISILVDYRNNVAHSDYENIPKEKAIRQMNSAFDLLVELSELRSELKDIDDEEISELTDLPIQ